MTQMRKSMPVVDWPIVDHEMWDDLVRAGGLFDDQGALSRLRPSTMRNLTQSWGRFLEWLRLHDPASLTEPPIDRATLPRIRAWLEAECNLSPTSRLMFFSGVLRLLCAAAPESDWSAHRRIKIGLSRLAGRGDLSRKAGRILDSRVLLEAALRQGLSEGRTEPLGGPGDHRPGAVVGEKGRRGSLVGHGRQPTPGVDRHGTLIGGRPRPPRQASTHPLGKIPHAF